MALAGYEKYKIVTLPGSGFAETNINFEITVLKESAMEDDFADIRFTESDDTQLDQFRYSYSSGVSAVYFIKVPTLPADGKTIRMYYGNSGASLLSSGEDTFPLFDNFVGSDGDPPDATKWTISDNDYVKIDTNNLWMRVTWLNLDQNCTSIQEFGAGYSVRMKFKKEDGGTGRVKCGINNEYYYHTNNSTDTTHWFYKAESTAAPANGDDASHVVEIKRVDSELVRYYFDETEDWDKDTSDDSADKKIILRMIGTNPSDPFWCDWIFAYKISQNGVEFGSVTFGDEQDVLDADFSADDTTPNLRQIVRFTDDSTSDDTITSWAWDFGDGETSTEQNPHHAYMREGTYSVSLTVSTANNSDIETKTSYITVGARADNNWTGNMLDDIGVRILRTKLDERINI